MFTYFILLFRHECFTWKYTTRKIHTKLGTSFRDLSGVFSISSLAKVLMISLISSLSLKLYLHLLVYDQNIFAIGSFLESLWQFSEILGKFWKMFGSIRLAFGTILENLRKSLESGRKSSENGQKRHHQYVYRIKRTLHVSSKIWILCFHGKNNIYCFCHLNIK